MPALTAPRHIQHVEYRGRRFALAPNGGGGTWTFTEQPGYHPIYSAKTEADALIRIGALCGATPGHALIQFATVPSCPACHSTLACGCPNV